jgi:hypothetical protein
MGNWASQAQAALKFASLWRPLDEWSAFNIEAPRRRVSLALSSFVVFQPYVVGHTLVMVKFRN